MDLESFPAWQQPCWHSLDSAQRSQLLAQRCYHKSEASHDVAKLYLANIVAGYLKLNLINVWQNMCFIEGFMAPCQQDILMWGQAARSSHMTLCLEAHIFCAIVNIPNICISKILQHTQLSEDECMCA